MPTSLRRVRATLLYLVSSFAITFVVNAIAVYGWNFVSHGVGAFNWPASLIIATTVSIVLTAFEIRKDKE